MAPPQYYIFEKFPDGAEVWRGVGTGLDDLRAKLEQLTQQSRNAFFALPVRLCRKKDRGPVTLDNDQVC